jgi:tetratricopeptide (TPR) repeat protein
MFPNSHRTANFPVALSSLAIGLAVFCVVARAQSRVSRPVPAEAADAGEHQQYTGLVRSGEALGKSHDYAGALRQYDKALALGPPTPRALSVLLTYRAGALWHLGRSAEALADQNRAVEADPNAFALWARAETLRKLKRYADSLRDYDAALRIAPDDAPAHAGRGIDLWRLGKIQEAQRVFDRAVALKADRYTLMRRAEFLIGQRKLKDAISDYSKVIALDPSYFPARVNRGNALAELGDYDKALDDYNVALRMHKNDAVTYRGRGWVFERQGRMDRARADYRRALELAPNDRWLQNALKKLLQ